MGYELILLHSVRRVDGAFTPAYDTVLTSGEVSRSIVFSSAGPLLFVLVAAILLAGCSGDEPGLAPDAPPETSSSNLAPSVGDAATGSTTTPMPPTTAEESCPPDGERRRIGDFTPLEDPVPPYEVLDEERVKQDCASAIRLLVDTQVQEKDDYTLIARDLKARHRDLDAVSVEFTDTEDTFSYTGAALIFNTSIGARFIGYAYGAPNDEGYYVAVAED